MKIHTFLITVFAASILPACAEVQPNSLFSDNAVLQRDKEIPVWGTARDGEKVTVEFSGQRVFTVAKDGKWKVLLKPKKANATPQTMIITGDNTVTLANILVGDVWVASGQSNMERQLGPREGQKLIDNWKAEAAAANYPLFHEFYVPENFAFTPVADANGLWNICSPQTVKDFSAVGYFFARDVLNAEKIPIGILFTAVGGTPAESWMSAATLKTTADFKDVLRLQQQLISSRMSYDAELACWYAANDQGSKGNWHAPELSLADWGTMNLPGMFENDFAGTIWFRKEIELPELWAGKAVILSLGAIDDADTTWVNGVRVGAMNDWRANRHYQIPAGVLKPGRNVIAVRALNISGPGGFSGRPGEMNLEISGVSQAPPISLAGQWRCREGGSAEKTPLPAQPDTGDYTQPTVLYNAMIAPLQPFPIKGVIWYQGENNVDRAKQYQTLFPLLISDWRQKWHCGEFPFLFVQIAPYRDMTPELREAQFLTLKKSPNTAMAVITDAGDADDIHPAKKQVPGERLALAARALAYGEKIEYSGPLYDSMKVEGNKAMISFTHIGGGLVAGDGVLKGFVIDSADKKFVPAHAEIEGRKVMVWSDAISKPAAVRYGWDNVPDVNLYNKDGLPASPFRTDN
jgi:sialate O-acetylesterase